MSDSAILKKPPVVTYTVIGLCVAVYLWEMVNERAVDLALVAPVGTKSIAAAGALLTMTLVHLGIAHIVFNLLAFSTLGRLIEMMYGSFRLAIMLIALAWVASAAQLLFGGGIGVGLSGVVYGIFGFMLGAAPSNQFLRWFVKKNAAMLIGWAVLCLVLTQTHVLAIANAAHFGGLFYGAIIGLIFGLPRFRYVFLGFAVLIPIGLGIMLWV